MSRPLTYSILDLIYCSRTVLAFISFIIAVGLAALTIGLRRQIDPAS